ncbi:cytochrome P450 [Gandjariella thermophila]|uniref:Cytochrome P450 n=1 Tax=Gandjariella thermophila TaxID=1931992 RepID=A0A4D4J8B3_9PSEU|nr:cytochrome P450 [Gandjariella thermophila]GDY30113.1 cytochrome P450 [Gandjariella thermophila]
MSPPVECPFPAVRGERLDPAPMYGRLRTEQPVSRVVLRNGERAWLVTRHADVRAVLRDRRFTSDPTAPGFPQLRPIQEPPPPPGTFLSYDPPRHTRFRRMLGTEFGAGRLAAFQPEIDRIVAEQLDALAGVGPGADLVRTFARPVPSRGICALLGVPFADRAEFQRHIEVRLDWSRPAEEVQAANAAVRDYIEGLVAAKEAEPTDDLIGRLVRRQVRTGRLRHEELVSMAMLLLVAGPETTASTIALGVLALRRDPDQWEALVADPGLVDGAVEELLRYLSVVQNGVVRAAVADVEIGGQRIAAGEGVIALLPSANRDPAAFADPDRLDVRRDARGHLAFGYGVHQCIGALLARLELRGAFRGLLRRLPGLRLAAPEADLRLQHGGAVFGVRELPVRW